MTKLYEIDKRLDKLTNVVEKFVGVHFKNNQPIEYEKSESRYRVTPIDIDRAEQKLLMMINGKIKRFYCIREALLEALDKNQLLVESYLKNVSKKD